MIQNNTYLGELKELIVGPINPGSNTILNGSIIGGAWGTGSIHAFAFGVGSTNSLTISGTAGDLDLLQVRTDTTKSFSGWIRGVADGVNYIWDDRSNNILALDLEAGSIRLFNCSGAGGCVVMTAAAFTYANTWIHLATIYDTSDTVGGAQIWVNGKLLHQSGATKLFRDLNGATYFGSNGGTQRYFSGLMNEFSIYNTRLTEAEIGSLYNKKQVRRGLQGYWPLNEGIGSIVYDYANGNFDYYTDTINGTIQEISLLPSTSITTGSLFIFISGLEEQLMSYSSGISNTDYTNNYPIVYSSDNSNTTGSPQGFTRRIINGPLHIVGSNMYETQLKILYT